METVAVRHSKRQVGIDIQVAYDIRTCAIFFSGRVQLQLCGFQAWDCAGIFFQNICTVLQNP